MTVRTPPSRKRICRDGHVRAVYDSEAVRMSDSAETIAAVYSNHAHALGAGRSPQFDDFRKLTDELVDVACANEITAIREEDDGADGRRTCQKHPAREISEGLYGSRPRRPPFRNWILRTLLRFSAIILNLCTSTVLLTRGFCFVCLFLKTWV